MHAKRIRKHIEYSVKGKRKGSPLYSVVGPQEIILSCKDAHSGWYSGFDYDKFQGLEIFLVPRQDMKKYYNAVKTNGYSNLKLESTLEISLVEFITLTCWLAQRPFVGCFLGISLRK